VAEARGLPALGQSVRLVKHRSAKGLTGAQRGMLAQADDRIIAGLEKITVPTLVLVGANDTHFLVAADHMARKIPGSTRVTIPDAGHASDQHQPALFNRAVSDFS
jgi:pimeloyl-ACP methyl ester carboxylesterase